jgi:ribose 5-phosphate isomerase RpiB
MILTARQLEDLHRQSGGNGQITLPYRARLTPLAVDWVKQRKIALGYSSVAAPTNGNANDGNVAAPGQPQAHALTAQSVPLAIGRFLYWCDGPCGPTKAALVAHERESSLAPMDKPADPRQLAAVIKAMAVEVKSGRKSGGVLVVQHGAAAVVLANRCPSLRAILGTSLEAVEQGIRQVAANVLIIEHPRNTLQQAKNLLSRFVRGARQLDDEMKRQIEELASCG